MRKPTSVERGSRRTGGRSTKPRRKHLYLVLDDWNLGYSIRKVDLASDDGAPSRQVVFSSKVALERLPPAVVRLKARPGMPDCFAAAFDTKIIALLPTMFGHDCRPLAHTCVSPIFDVRTRGLNFAPRPERLFVLSAKSFRVLCPPPAEDRPRHYWDGSWMELPKHPFKRRHVTSYALHPDGRTILVSTKREGTFSFGTEWKHHGAWVLPFHGRAHFDCELKVWIGLSGDPSTTGHLCAFGVPSDSGAIDGLWATKLSKENVFSEDPNEKHIGATLVHMGGKGKFCLVQCVSIDDDGSSEEDLDLDELQPCSLLLRLTTFSLKFDMDGDLTTGNSCRVRCYKLSKAVSQYAMNNPVAFWM
ncbi:hypothetical protein ACP70R_025404 [Stipagrostis hirtigluma subsp. patula]